MYVELILCHLQLNLIRAELAHVDFHLAGCAYLDEW